MLACLLATPYLYASVLSTYVLPQHCTCMQPPCQCMLDSRIIAVCLTITQCVSISLKSLFVSTGDVITGINDRKVTKAADLAISLDSFKVGDKVVLKVRRGDEGSQVSNPSACTSVQDTKFVSLFLLCHCLQPGFVNSNNFITKVLQSC